MWLSYVSLLLALLLCSAMVIVHTYSGSDIETYTFQTFPKDKIALHMPCEESNMFATKCMCHLRCKDDECNNAREICMKYRSSKGCKYMLIRGGRNRKIATLKRSPTEKELEGFDLSMYPKTFDALQESKWKQMNDASLRNQPKFDSTPSKSQQSKGTSFEEMVQELGGQGQQILGNLYQKNGNLTDNKFCPKVNPTASKSPDAKFLSNGVSLVALSYHAPLTLLNSMRTWKQSGLLDVVREKFIILNDPLPQEVFIALDHGFTIVQPKDIPNAKMTKDNVLTIGAAYYYALQMISTDYLLFLENDFKMDVELPLNEVRAELLTAAGLLDTGIQVIRLNSRKYKGCGTFKDCDHHGINLDSNNPDDTKRNWFAFYCRERTDAKGHVSDCHYGPDYRCFSSWDSNWTLNAVLVKKSSMLKNQYQITPNNMKTLAAIGLGQWEKQDGFESVMAFSLPWQKWKVPICISYQGLFIHEEIETST